MPQHFLACVLEDLQKKGVDLLSCTYVLPSKRSGTFLKKYIAHTLTQNSFAPKIVSIQDFIAELSGMTLASSIDLLLQLYEVHKKTTTGNPEDFYTFLKWGSMLIQDFNDIDSFLVPSKDILNYLFTVKELHHWAVAREKNPLVENYLKFWKHLQPLYTAFTSALLTQKKGYSGLLYRRAVTHLEAYSKNLGSQPVVFIGFNALNSAEANIIQHFLKAGNGRVYWDIDTYFLNDPLHEAGFFIRKYQREWPYYQKHPLLGIHRSFLAPKEIAVVGVPKNIAQTKYVGQLLQQIATQSPASLEKTALVLADESLLHSMLTAIPATVHGVNITMGMPLKKTVLHTFFLSFLRLHSSKTERGWFYRDVLAFITNPYAVKFSDVATVLAKDIKVHNWLYIHTSLLSSYTTSHAEISLLFPQNTPAPLQWIKSCLAVIENLKNTFQVENNRLELEYLYRFNVLFHQLEEYVENTEAITELKALKELFSQLADMEMLDFIGEPLTGLQIMGMLESRNLDFDTVIITSVNEGILPLGKSNNSFIPFDVKRSYGLPTYKERDAIYTYHFYRLIQRAKKVYLLYNTEPDVLEGGEKSRLLSQLLTDEAMAPYVTHTIASPKLTLSTVAPVVIAKSTQLLEDLKMVAGKGFSPTSLTNYIRNPLEFYKRSILKINEVEEVEESIAAHTFGTILHNSLEQLYTPLVGELLTVEKVSTLKPQISSVVKEHFHSNLPGVDSSKGRFLLVYHVMVTYIRRFIAHELQQLSRHQVKLLALEETYEVPLVIPELDFPVKLKGKLDRVDEVDGMLRIVDYKTGKVEPRHVTLSNWEVLLTKYDKSKAFQLLCYAFLYNKHHHSKSMQAGIYSFKNFGQGFLAFTTGQNNTQIDCDTLTTFETYVKQLILEICTVEIPFAEKSV